MDFFTAMNQTQTNVSRTENGMVGYKTTYHPLVDMNFKLSSYRKLTDAQIVADFNNVLASNDAEYALKYLFMARDAREGLGERRFFKVCLKSLLNKSFENKDEIITNLIQTQIVEYGRYDDLFIFMGTDYEDVMVSTVLSQLKSDFANMNNGKSISLLAKWMPSANASSKETKKLAYKFMNAFGASAREYRKTLSALRAYSNVVEVKTSAKAWGEIDYSAVPSKANLKYKDAFLRNDETRRRDYLAALRVGATIDGKVAKINSGVNFPHEVLHKYMTTASWGWRNCSVPYDEAIEQLWKALKNKEGMANTIVVRDDSGSMTTSIDSGKTSAYEVATALSIYCAERLQGAFNNKLITFSHTPRYIDMTKCETLAAKLKTCLEHSEVADTNVQAVFELILRTAVDHKMSADEIPAQVLILSDMEFNSCADNANANVFTTMANKFAAKGYKLPKLVFWNIASRSGTIPCKENDNGVLLVSGFSTNVLNQVLNGETDPFVSLAKELDSERYAAIPKLAFTTAKATTGKTTARRSSTRNTKKDFKPSFLG